MSDTSVERKTDTDSVNNPTELVIVASGGSKGTKPKKRKKNNILNSYRSYTYKFTLAALKTEDANNPDSYRYVKSALDLVILQSGGKKSTGLNATGSSGIQSRLNENLTSDDEGNANVVYDKQGGQALVKEFNEKSPGRFDMYIDNVDIKTFMGFSKESNTTFAKSLSFEIFEPYSISGFIEAISVAAVAAGYVSYMEANFLLKIEFIGYLDSEDLPTPEPVGEKATRYFPFRFRTVDLDITESGSRYRCTGVPMTDTVLGETVNTLVAPVKITGKTVKDILTDLMVGRTKQQKDSDKDSKTAKDSTKSDEWEIKFPTVNSDGSLDFTKDNDIAKSAVLELGKDKAVYGFDDPGTTTKPTGYQLDPNIGAGGGRGGQGGPTAEQNASRYAGNPTPQENAQNPTEFKLVPGENTSQFNSGMNIHECISSLIRDSTYIRDILANISGNKDDKDMIPYFMVRTETTYTGGVDATAGKSYQKYTYIVTPYKIHVSHVPDYQSLKYDFSKVEPLVFREYDYLYTGQNTDIIKFNLNFNTLFYEAIPKAQGISQYAITRDAVGPNQAVNPVVNRKDIDGDKNKGMSSPKTVPTPAASEVQPTGGNGISPLNSPYAILAKNLHESMLNITGSMIKSEIEILGDPYYLVTGGIGNYRPKMEAPGLTKDGEADHNYGQVLIKLNFRNPEDINPLDKGGRMNFGTKKVSFSGVFMVREVRSSFRDGQFRQHIDAIRMFGQIMEDNIKPDNVAEKMTTFANPLTNIVADVGRPLRQGQRASEQSLLGQLLKIGGTIAGAQNILAGAVGQAQNALIGVLGAPTAAAAQIANKITNTINGITSPIANAAAQLGISPGQLSSMSLSDLLAVKVASALLPDDVNVSDLQAFGAVFVAAKASNYPPSANYATAPAAGANISDGTSPSQASILETGVTVATKTAKSSGAEINSYLNNTEFFRPSTTSVNVNSTPSVTDKYSPTPTSPLAKLNITDPTY
jgi:hypothetical protein